MFTLFNIDCMFNLRCKCTKHLNANELAWVAARWPWRGKAPARCLWSSRVRCSSASPLPPAPCRLLSACMARSSPQRLTRCVMTRTVSWFFLSYRQDNSIINNWTMVVVSSHLWNHLCVLFFVSGCEPVMLLHKQTTRGQHYHSLLLSQVYRRLHEAVTVSRRVENYSSSRIIKDILKKLWPTLSLYSAFEEIWNELLIDQMLLEFNSELQVEWSMLGE